MTSSAGGRVVGCPLIATDGFEYYFGAVAGLFGSACGKGRADGEPVDALFVNNLGNVGVGTTNPQRLLHIQGPHPQVRVTNGTDSIVEIAADGQAQGIVFSKDQALTNTSAFIGQHVPGNAVLIDDLVFATRSGSWSEAMRIVNTSRNVGIGTTSPVGDLQVFGSVDSRTASGRPIGIFRSDSNNTIFGVASRDYAQLEITNADQTANNLSFVSFSDNATGGFPSAAVGTKYVNHGNNFGDLFFWTRGSSGSAERLYITSNGDIGIGTTTPTHPLHMGSGAHVTAGGVWTDASSRTLKTRIRHLPEPEALDVLQALTPVTFSYKANLAETHVGFIAEDVPNLVAMNDRKGLAAMDIMAVLTKVVQQQQKQIETLEERLNRLLP